MATIYDVAKAAGVTAATVSNVITGKGAVGAKTRQRVEQAIAELGYQPNMLARGLATRQTYTIALILPNIANPFYPEIALEVEDTARQHGYSLFLCNTRNDEAIGHTYLQQLAGRQVDGVIALPGGLSLEDLSAATRGTLPVVLCNWEERDELPPLPMAGVDFFAAGSLAARHLLALGHRRIGVVADAAVPHTRHTERVAGFAATLGAAGVPWDPALLWLGDSSIESGYAAIEAISRLPEQPTALFCTNDLMAIGALEGALAHGIAVPDGISIIGLDDIAMSAYTHPPLTTIAIPKRRIAVETTTLLLRWLGGAMPPAAETCQLPAALVQRRSTAAIGPAISIASLEEHDRYRHLLDVPLGVL
jgi:DNA-binding LacI/PurR family transcriptional regulator